MPLLSEIDAGRSGEFSLIANRGETAFLGGIQSKTLGFNQSYLGPVVRVRPGIATRATVANRCGRSISVHWHGLLIEGEFDGGPHNLIEDGATWEPVLAIDQSPATLWYHAHLHSETAETIYAGLAGVLLVDDGNDVDRGLPAAAGIDDLVLVIQDKRFDPAGRMVYEPGLADMVHGFLGNAIVVNGALEPIAAVPAGIVRLRIINASNGRNYDLLFSDARPFHLIATDQGYLHRAIEVSSLRVTPGERVELLVDFAPGGAKLVSNPHTETMGAGGMDHAMAAPLVDAFGEPFVLVEFDVDRDLPVAVASVPATIGEKMPPPTEPVTARSFSLNDMGTAMAAMPEAPMSTRDHMMGRSGMDHMAHAPAAAGEMFAINGQAFSMDRTDFTAVSGTTERWTVSGQMMGHPFHVHGARVRVVSENGEAPRIENSGWKDTVFVEGEVEMHVEFRHTAQRDKPFMYHCHILEHEDRGMMGQFAVS